jgi:hypothetical protein
MAEFRYIIKKLKRYGLFGVVIVILNKLKGNQLKKKPALIKGFDKVEKYFANKTGLEIGGPSWAFTKSGYIPIYDKMRGGGGGGGFFGLKF